MKTKKNPQIVTAAIIEKDGRVLIGKRKEGKHHAGKWEFPGGTLEEGETHRQCLKRELHEELAVDAEIGELYCIGEHVLTPQWTIRLFAYRVNRISGIVKQEEHEELKWVRVKELIDYEFPEADRPIVEKLISECNAQSPEK
jgi:8-oxo-dGTP diphosphatase